MAELHILGQISGALGFSQNSSLFCRYSFQAGPNWTLISGTHEGQTISNSSLYDKSIVWEQPIDIHYVTKGLQGWPKLLLQIVQLDAIGRCWLVGYGSCGVPAVPGNHIIKVPCWMPCAVSITDRIRQYFLGGSHQLLNPDIFLLGVDRYKLKTESKGNVTLNLNIILRNFKEFGVEYK